MNRICHIEIDERGLVRPTPEIEQERRVAIFDLLEDNSFGLPPATDRELPPAPTASSWRSAKGGSSSTSRPRMAKRRRNSTCRSAPSGRW